jgi:hypothetical protein
MNQAKKDAATLSDNGEEHEIERSRLQDDLAQVEEKIQHELR